MRVNVQEHLGKINDIPNPGMLLNVPSTLDEIIKEMNKHVKIKAHVPKPKASCPPLIDFIRAVVPNMMNAGNTCLVPG